MVVPMETHPLIGTTYIFSKKKLPHRSLRRKPPLQSVNFNTGRRNLNRSQRRKARLPSRSQSSPECLQSCTWSIAAPEGTAVSFAPFKTRYFHSAFSFFQFSFNEHNLTLLLLLLLLIRHPDAKITGEATPTATGYLEVTVDGMLVHSKDNGDGYVDTAEKMEKILDAVRKGS